MSGSALVPVAVLVDLPQHTGLTGALTYTHSEALLPGTLVRVPLGRREVLGLVWDVAPAEPVDGGALRALAGVLTQMPPLNAAWRQLVKFSAEYYQRAPGELALSVLPPELRRSDPQSWARRCARLAKKRATTAVAPSVSAGAQGPAVQNATWGQAPPTATSPSRSAPDSGLPELTPEQAAVLSAWRSRDGFRKTPGPAATAASPASETVLLQGVTGSGKTEVYLRMAQDVLSQGRQVLMMVPEINLTPQFEQRLRERFAQHHLVTLHSGLTPAQRVNHWLEAHLGHADLLLGTRLSVMASLPRLGLIVVDEEHDPSYKQQEGARYSARDLAVYRGHLEQVPVVLGSATPSLETWRHATEGRYGHLQMPTRVGSGRLPRVELIDMNQQPKVRGGGSALSPRLVAEIQSRIDRGEQSLLLLNRRGYAPVLHCTACAWKSACSHCSAWQVFHKIDRSLRCHHCGAAHRVPKACPDCGNLDLSAIGRGTERLEEQIGPLLTGRNGQAPRVLRIDADSTRAVGSLERQLAQVHDGDVDVLVGTQMVAKGHDFRRITLVAAINPDGALFTSDFRAPERLFALLMQAAGRAGRDAQQAESSRMIVQTWHPAHPLYQALLRHDYEAFAGSQLEERQAVGLPPFSHLAVLRVEARDLQSAQAYLDEAQAQLRSILKAHPHWQDTVSVYPAVPAPVARVADLDRLQMLLESSARSSLQGVLRSWSPMLVALRSNHRAVMRWALDVDPLSL